MKQATSQGPRVVHSGRGRLRVHLPDPGGAITARLRRLPGVTSAEASELTGNLLVLFDPRQTSEQALLAEMCVDLPIALAEPVPSGTGGEMTAARRRLFQALGWTSVGVGGVGVVTPGLPTVPFVVLAGYFFMRSSPAAHEWLRQSRWFGPSLREWEEHHAVRRSVKVTTVGVMGAGLAVTVLLGLPWTAVAAIAALEAVGLTVVLRLPEVPPDEGRQGQGEGASWVTR